MKHIATAAQHRKVESLELETFRFGSEKPKEVIRPAVNAYFCAADGYPMVKPGASASGLGTWQPCKVCHGRKVRRERL